MEKNILFFDGVCHLCNGYISFLVKFKSEKIFYAPLQGLTASKILAPEQIKNVDSILYRKNHSILTKSTAIIESLYDASPLFFWIKLLNLIPRFLRDSFYDMIARNRYRLFGKSETCRIPMGEEKKYILE